MEWFPEVVIWECGACGSEVPPEHIWRGRGLLVSSRGGGRRTTILRSECPDCGMRQSLGIEGPWWRVLLFQGLWRLRYGARREGTALSHYLPRRAPAQRVEDARAISRE